MGLGQRLYDRLFRLTNPGPTFPARPMRHRWRFDGRYVTCERCGARKARSGSPPDRSCWPKATKERA